MLLYLYIANVYLFHGCQRLGYRDNLASNISLSLIIKYFTCICNSYLRRLVDDFNHCGDNLMNRLMKLADGKTKIKMLNHFNHVSLDLISKVSKSTNISTHSAMKNTNIQLFELVIFFTEIKQPICNIYIDNREKTSCRLKK